MAWAHHHETADGNICYGTEFLEYPKGELDGAHLLGKHYSLLRGLRDYHDSQLGKVSDKEEGRCYLICHGENLGLYMDFRNFMKNREPGPGRNLTMAREFSSLKEAQRYCQAVRDDEGHAWGWPAHFPIYWKKLP